MTQAEEVSTGAFERIEARLEAGGPVILDGAIGTELERLGARMDQGVWCARALAENPDLVHEVHRRYLDAGADIITANSYSATREAMQRHGLAAHFEDWNRRAAQIALEERDRSPRSGSVAVAGSVSSYGRFDALDWEPLLDHFRAQGAIPVEEGVDLLILESLGSIARTVKAMVSATKDLGVAVWAALSCLRDRDTVPSRMALRKAANAADAAQSYESPVPGLDDVRRIHPVTFRANAPRAARILRNLRDAG